MQLVCISRDSSFDKNKYLNHVFSMNNYNDDFIKRKKYMKVSPNCTFDPLPVRPTSTNAAHQKQRFRSHRLAHKISQFFSLRQNLFSFSERIKSLFWSICKLVDRESIVKGYQVQNSQLCLFRYDHTTYSKLLLYTGLNGSGLTIFYAYVLFHSYVNGKFRDFFTSP